ncbi:MAG: Phospholipid scramblase 3 [Pleopsidium flavum]|nr:MAG: Phospholipid scramblase 3 [Pleopsidium flavum]
MLRKILRPPSLRLLRASYANKAQKGPRNTFPRHQQPSRIPKAPESSPGLSKEGSSRVEAVSDALRDTKADQNNLLSPVYIPEDPNGVLNERHPAAGLLANSSIVVQRQLELMNVMIGFEQANKYVIMDPQGNHIGYMAEQELGMGNMMARQWFRTHRSFTTHVFDRHEKEVLRFHRPFSWISSRIRVYDPLEVAAFSHSTSTALQGSPPGSLSTGVSQSSAQISPLPLSDMRIIGEAQQQWAPLRRKYNLFLYHAAPNPETDLGTRQIASGGLPLSTSQRLQVASQAGNNDVGEYSQFAFVDEPFLSWDFSLLSANSRLIGSVNRNFAGFGREIFTDTGVYALRMDAAGIADEPRHLISQTGKRNESSLDDKKVGMTLDQRAVMLATAVSVDFDYFSRKSGAGGMGMMPLWFPGGGEAAGGAAAGGAAGGAVEGGAGAAGAVGNAARGAGGIGEGAAVGAGTMAGYEAMQRGAYGDGASPTAEQTPPAGDFGAGQAPPPSQSPAPGQGEDVWGEDSNPWGGGQGGGGGSSGGGSSGGGGGGGGGDGGGFDIGDWF